MITKQTIPIGDIVTDAGTQPRQLTTDDVVQDYSERMLAGDVFPPLDVFHDGSRFVLVDGFHRFFAEKRAGRSEAWCNVHQGTVADAVMFAARANQSHGIRRTNADKRRAVRMVLRVNVDWSDRRIAEHVGVGHQMVATTREAFQVDESSTCGEPTVRKGIDGKEYKAVTPNVKKQETISEQSPTPAGGASFAQPSPTPHAPVGASLSGEEPNEDDRVLPWLRRINDESMAIVQQFRNDAKALAQVRLQLDVATRRIKEAEAEARGCRNEWTQEVEA